MNRRNFPPRWLPSTPPECDDEFVAAPIAGAQVLRRATLRLVAGENLTRAESVEFLNALVDANATDAQIAAALTALAIKGETVEELAGMAEAMLDRAVEIHSRHRRFIDTAGTGSSASKTFNVSTAAAFVIAGAGLPVAKHGSRAATSHCGSADVLEALGVNTSASGEVVERCLNEHGICFMFAPQFHGATARVAQVRRQLGMHTTFNLLGPLTNPARAPFRLLGVWHSALVEHVAAALRMLGAERAWVVHGADGLDEITLSSETFVASTANSSTVETFTIAPEHFGLARRSLEKMRGGAPGENACLIEMVLNRDPSVETARDLVLINAAAALHLAGLAARFSDASALARESIDSGRAASKLQALIRETNRGEG
jgi:anthranilate phosphoribosyltransferase